MIKLSKKQEKIVKEIEESAEQYASKGNPMAIKDLAAVKAFRKKGILNKNFKALLNENIIQIDYAGFFDQVSQDKKKTMQSILKLGDK